MSIDLLNLNNGNHVAVTPVQANGIANGNTQQVAGNSVNASDANAVSDQALKAAIDDANKMLATTTTRCEYSYDEDCKRVSIKIFNADTDEVIKEIPSEERLEAIKKLQELAGLMIDEKR